MIPKIKFRFSINKNKIDLKIFDISEYTSWHRILVSLNRGIVGFSLIFNRSIPLISLDLDLKWLLHHSAIRTMHH